MDVVAWASFFFLAAVTSCFPQDGGSTGIVLSLPGTPCTTNEGLNGTCEGLFTCETVVKGHTLGVIPTKCPGPFNVLICCSYEAPPVPVETQKPEEPPSLVGDVCTTDAGDTGTCTGIFSCPGSAANRCPGPVKALVCCVDQPRPVVDVTQKPEEPTSSVGASCLTEAGDTGTCKNILSCPGLDLNAITKCPGPLKSLICCADHPRPAAPVTLKPEETTNPVGAGCFTEEGDTGTCTTILNCPNINLDVVVYRCPGPLRSLICCIDQSSPPSGVPKKIDQSPSSVGDSCFTVSGQVGICRNISRCSSASSNPITKCPGPLHSLVCCLESDSA